MKKVNMKTADNKVEAIDIENRTFYHQDDLINIDDLHLENILVNN